jgi:hypothetical protein
MVSTIGVMEGPNPDRDLTPSNDETTECDPRDQVQLILGIDPASIERLGLPRRLRVGAGKSQKARQKKNKLETA